MSDPDEPAAPAPDPALATERTALAWTRTALTGAGLAAVSLRLLDRDASVVLVLALATIVALPGVLGSWWRLRDLRDGPPGPPPPWVVAVLAGTLVLVDAAVVLRLVTRL